MEAVFDQIRSEHGRLDILVNNVCWNGLDTMLGKPFWELTDIDGVIPDDSHKAGAADGDVPSFWKDVLGES